MFWYWSNLVLPNLDRGKQTFDDQRLGCEVIIVLTSAYLLVIEISAMIT